MALLRVLLGFTDASDHQLEETAGHIIDNLFVPPASIYFPHPTAALGAVQEALTAFTAAIAAQRDGGPQATAAKEQARQTLIAPLRQLALYVQGVVQGNPSFGLAELLASGFDAVSTTRTQKPLDQPLIQKVLNEGSGQLKLMVGAVRNARTYEVQTQAAGGAWQSAGAFASTRGMVVTGLTPGVMYALRVRAVGGSTGYSPWSDAVSHMSL